MAEVGWELSNKKCACAALQAKAGGEGSRTPVLVAIRANIYMFIRRKVLRSRTLHRHTAGSRASAKSIHKPTRSLRQFASLLSTFPTLAGVAPETSRSIKPRERDLRDLRLFFWSGFLRGQRTILDMPPALPTMSRSQCAPDCT